MTRKAFIACGLAAQSAALILHVGFVELAKRGVLQLDALAAWDFFLAIVGLCFLGLFGCFVALLVLAQRDAILRNLWVLLLHAAFLVAGLMYASRWSQGLP